jgi:hypothetical protein
MDKPSLCPVCGTLMYQGRCGNPSCGYVEQVDVETVGNAKAEGGEG